MKEFDIEKIGKAMPYKAPEKEFFDNFSTNLNKEINRRRYRRVVMWPSIAAAAMVAFGVMLGVNTFENNYNKKNSLDNFLVNLSDEELNSLITDIQYVDDFYENL